MDDQERVCQNDLTNYTQLKMPAKLQQKFKKKREMKQNEKREQKFCVQRSLDVNSIGNASNLFKTLRSDIEVYKQEPSAPCSSDIKLGSTKILNDYINLVLADQDPDQGVEEEYKRKHEQLFCWRFLRAISFVDQQCFQKKTDQNISKTFAGDVEEVANYIHA